MKVRGYVLLFLVAGLGLWCLSSLWNARHRLQQNSVRYELNSNNLAKADQVLSKITFGNDRRWDDLRLESLIRNGNFKAANLITGQSGRAKFWSAVSAFLHDRDDAAAALLVGNQDALVTEEELLTFRWMSSVLNGTPAPKGITGAVNNTLRAAIYLARGRLRERAGLMGLASRDLSMAWQLTERLSALAPRMTRTAVLAGDYYMAQSVIDQESTRTETYRILLENLKGSEETTDILLSPLSTPPLSNKLQHLRGAAWCDLQLQRTGEDTVTSEQLELALTAFPNDPVLLTLAAEWEERAGNYAASYQLYQASGTTSSLGTCLKVQSLIAGKRVNIDECSSLISQRVVNRFENSAVNGQSSYVQVANGGAVRGNINISDARAYQLVLVADAHHFNDLGPIVDVIINGKWTGQFYLGREGVECYTLDLPLVKGIHQLELRYLNSETSVNGSGSRNFLFGTLLVARTDNDRDGSE